MKSLGGFVRSLVLLLALQMRRGTVVVVEAFPNGAGACPYGEPAVSGRHVSYDGGTRLVENGPMYQNKIQFFCNGQELSANSPIQIAPSAEHTLEIVAPRAFKGALIRVASVAADNGSYQYKPPQHEFILAPMINSQVAAACTSTDQVHHTAGVTHVDASDKHVLSAGFLTNAEGADFKLDVTVVDYNNATGSIYWYSQFTIATKSLAPPPSSPVPSTFAPTSTYSPTVTEMPSYSEACFVCGDEMKEVTATDKIVTFMTLSTTCGDLAKIGRTSDLPPSLCPEAQILAQTVCECASTAAAVPVVPSFGPTATPYPTYADKCYVCGQGRSVGLPEREVRLLGEVATCRELQADGDQGLIPPETCSIVQEAAEADCFCEAKIGEGPTPSEAAVPTTTATYEPTATAYPTATFFPTFSSKCIVCKADGDAVTKSQQIVTLNGVMGTCSDLQEDGSSGYISPSLCPTAQEIALANCGCAPITFAPTVSSFPTATPYPTYTEKCNVCGRDGFRVTALDQVVALNGGVGTCLQLETDAAGGYIPPDLCDRATELAATRCACAEEAVKDDATPTSCNICATHGWKVTNMEALVTLDGYTGTCEELQDIATESLLQPALCPSAQVAALGVCGCSAATAANAPSLSRTFSPTVTPYPTFSFMPSYSEACYVCQPGQSVTKPTVLVTVDTILITCGELEEASYERMIPPAFCLEAQEEAEVACGCKTTAPSPSTAAHTFEPTITAYPTSTATPTFEEKCNVCGEGRVVSNEANAVTVDGLVLTCSELQEAGMDGIMPPQICADATNVAREACGCVNASPAPSRALTFEPTVTAYPTDTATPTYSERCAVCGKTELKITNSETLIAVGGNKITCQMAEEFGATGFLPPVLCPAVQRLAFLHCACRVSHVPPSVSTPSAATPTVAPTAPSQLVFDTPKSSSTARTYWSLISVLAVAVVL